MAEKFGQPLPAPHNSGKNVSEDLLGALHFYDESDNKDESTAEKLIKERVKYGMKKYGQPLMTDDGRDSIIDALQEAGDLMQYIWKAKMNKEDLSQVIYIVKIISKILGIN